MTVVQPGRMFVEFGVCGEALLTRRSSVTCEYESCRETNRPPSCGSGFAGQSHPVLDIRRHSPELRM
jgi:hypothetical protein